jgi:thiamine-monophosphate kinase
MPTVSELGERVLIQRITARLAQPAWVVVGPGDDAAVIEPEPRALDVLTTDAQVDGIHFDRRFVPPDAIGHRALAVNLSDLAAMGATPRAALLSLALPEDLPASFVDAMLDGLLALASRHRVALIGGNITQSPGPLVVDVTAIGAVGPRRILTRGGARPGDEVYVTGSIGGAAVGLAWLQEAPASGGDGPDDPSLRQTAERYLRPEPRVRAGMMLGRNRAASACMDLSDGLADGVRGIAEASNAGIAVDAGALPIDAAVRRWHEQRGTDATIAAVAGGDEYELLFTVRPAHRGRLRQVQRLVGDLPISRIGVVTKERKVVMREAGREREFPQGFEHFR